MTRIATVAVLLAAVPGLAAARQPDHIAIHGLAAFYSDADPHLGTGVSWQKQFGRNWALNSVPYLVVGGGLFIFRQRSRVAA